MWHARKVMEVLAEPVTLAEAQRQCSVTEDEFTQQIEMLIAAARGHAERYCHAAFAVQSVALTTDTFSDLARLPLSPIRGVTSISYIDTDGMLQTIDPGTVDTADDGIDSSVAMKLGGAWPDIFPGSRVTVEAVFGGAVPADVKHAILIYVFTHFEKRDDGARPSFAAIDALLSNHRRGAW